MRADIDGGGTTGSFAVTGTGTDGTGGTIQQTTQNGILIENTNNITLANMTFTNAADDGGGATCDEDTFTGCNAAIEFYKNAFGAAERFRLTTPDDSKIVHAEITIGDSTLVTLPPGLYGSEPLFAPAKNATLM